MWDQRVFHKCLLSANPDIRWRENKWSRVQSRSLRSLFYAGSTLKPKSVSISKWCPQIRWDVMLEGAQRSALIAFCPTVLDYLEAPLDPKCWPNAHHMPITECLHWKWENRFYCLQTGLDRIWSDYLLLMSRTYIIYIVYIFSVHYPICFEYCITDFGWD